MLVGGEVALTFDDLAGALLYDAAAPLIVLGHVGLPDGTIAVEMAYGIERNDVAASIQFWRAGELQRQVRVSLVFDQRRDIDQDLRQTDEPRVSPNGREIGVVLARGEGRLVIVDAQSGRPALGPVKQQGWDWSSDGNWLAVSTASGIDIYGLERAARPLFTLRVPVEGLAWRDLG